MYLLCRELQDQPQRNHAHYWQLPRCLSCSGCAAFSTISTVVSGNLMQKGKITKYTSTEEKSVTVFFCEFYTVTGYSRKYKVFVWNLQHLEVAPPLALRKGSKSKGNVTLFDDKYFTRFKEGPTFSFVYVEDCKIFFWQRKSVPRKIYDTWWNMLKKSATKWQMDRQTDWKWRNPFECA